jgi:Lipocalin-like domain
MAAMLTVGPGPAMSDPVKKEDLVGAWRYEARYIEFSDGHRETQYGEHPQGLIIILPNGWYSHVIMRDDLPRYGSGTMRKATDEEAQAAVVGSLPHFGTWTLDEREGTFIVHILSSIFPNSVGQEHRRMILELTKDRLHFVNEPGITGENARVHATLSRLWKPD